MSGTLRNRISLLLSTLSSLYSAALDETANDQRLPTQESNDPMFLADSVELVVVRQYTVDETDGMFIGEPVHGVEVTTAPTPVHTSVDIVDGVLMPDNHTEYHQIAAVGGSSSVPWSIDYTAATIGHGTFTRETTATYHNHVSNTANNRMKTTQAAVDTPCYEYPMPDGFCRGVMVRPAAVEYAGADALDLRNWDIETTSVTVASAGASSGMDGTGIAYLITGTNKGTTASRYMISRTATADGQFGGLASESSSITYTVGSGHPEAGQILIVTNSGGTTETGLAYVQSVDTGALTFTAIMLSGTISSTNKLYPPGTTTALCTATAAAADRTGSSALESVPLVAWMRVKSSTWPFHCIRVRNEAGIFNEWLYDLEQGTSKASEIATSTLGSTDFGTTYLHDRSFLLHAKLDPIVTRSSATIKMMYGFGKPHAVYVTGTGAQRAIDRVELVYGSISGTIGRIRVKVATGDNIIFFEEANGNWTNGDVLKLQGSNTTVGTIAVDSGHATPYYYTKGFSWMCVPTNVSGSAVTSINCASETLIAYDGGLTRGTCVYRTPIKGTLAFQKPANPTTYYVHGNESLRYEVLATGKIVPANNFGLVLKTFKPFRSFETRWKHGFVHVLGDVCTPYSSPFTFRITTAGTSGATEPDWSTATVAGNTVTDGSATWTAVNKLEQYLWATSGMSVRATNQRILVYVGASSINWAVNDSMLNYKSGTNTGVTPVAGNTVTGLYSEATATLLATPTLSVSVDSGAWANGTAEGFLSMRVTSGTFCNNEPLQIGGVTFATAVGPAMKTDYGVLSAGEYNIAVRKGSAGVQLWVNGRVVASSEAAGFQSSVTHGTYWYLGSDTNKVKQSDFLFREIIVHPES